ncbi:dihydrofolate reductase family protein [Nonomuraea sp. NBC_01738]|uniref:dihydrofolate reductase family protein n=1 Tax=Nonomuraea sp. NBC_01738 TaxID=2976003 RepID=UPI002E0DD89D|nr:dihydrofolate reductase family protein [Nonomuraea sp. NBC_01738]
MSTFVASVFIGTSVDGFIARQDGDIDWLNEHGEKAGDTGYDAFLAGVDTIVLGRATFEKLLSFGPAAWTYGDRHVAVLSTTLPDDADPRVTVHRSMDALTETLTARGARHVYADGGQVVQSFLRAGLVGRITLTTVPVLIGTGIPLFGALVSDLSLTHESTQVLGGGLVQTVYTIER